MNSTEQLTQSPVTELPPLRIVYKNAEVVEKKAAALPKKSKAASKLKKKVKKEPLPLFNDYKFKARDYDPL